MNKTQLSQFIKTESQRLGFDYCGISKAEFLEKEAPLLEKWLKSNMQGQMGWMANHFDKRLDPRLLVPGAKSVVSMLLNYYPEQEKTNSSYKVSKYAYGRDYHFVIKEKLFELLHNLQNKAGQVQGRAFVDSAPVMDKAWAQRSGLGWIGKNTNLIHKQSGSFFFIAEIIIDLELDYDTPVSDHCGTCTKCIDACPTGAITEPYVVDGSKCISYFTIELKEQIPNEVKGKMDSWIFGCDICQDVCPWNRFAKAHQTSHFNPNTEFMDLSTSDWDEITEDVFKRVFKDSPLQRPGFEGLKRNISFVQSK